jgi:hypothetical protein
MDQGKRSLVVVSPYNTERTVALWHENASTV